MKNSNEIEKLKHQIDCLKINQCVIVAKQKALNFTIQEYLSKMPAEEASCFYTMYVDLLQYNFLKSMKDLESNILTEYSRFDYLVQIDQYIVDIKEMKANPFYQKAESE